LLIGFDGGMWTLLFHERTKASHFLKVRHEDLQHLAMGHSLILLSWPA
jgi:hypothetical protein